MNATQINQLKEYKRLIKNTINKDSDLTLADFENFIRIKYGVTQFYNSSQEYYLKVYNQRIDDEIDQYIDCLCRGIVETTHRVFEYSNPKIKDKNRKKTAVYYSYEGNYIKRIFIEVGWAIDGARCLFMFINGGEEFEKLNSILKRRERQGKKRKH